MTKPYDAVVVGTGGVGSATLYHLANRGLRVLGIDRYPAGHVLGSSHGHTRIIRKAYFEHPAYVPLVLESYELWQQLEQSVGQQLLFPTGLLQIGPPAGVVLPGIAASAQQHHLHIERLTRKQCQLRYPQFRVPTGSEAIFEPDAGYLLVEECVKAHLKMAATRGAETLSATAQAWQMHPNGLVEIQTDAKTILAEQLVVTAGAWSGKLLDGINLPLVVRPKDMHWFQNEPSMHSDQHCPIFFYEVPTGYYYGFPQIDERGVKVAEHWCSDDQRQVEEPSNVDRAIDPVEQARVMGFVRDALPHTSTQPTDHSVCMYTMTPDEHFIIDHIPDQPRVHFAAGMSGHGFKFTPAIGRALADRVSGTDSTELAFLKLDRFA